MIKIKDYIFNENEIKWYEKDNEDIKVVFVNDTHIYIDDTTFEDIEWNYGNTELEELKLDYSAVVTGYKKLEEENKELVETNYNLATKKTEFEEENKKLKETIKELSLQNKTTIKGYDYLKPPYELTCKGEK